MKDTITREAIYLWYYFDLQLHQIFRFWVLGMIIGSAISVFAKDAIHKAAGFLGNQIPSFLGIIIASLLGIASPLCMYGTIPICAAFSRKGLKDDFLAAFMMSSILLNPQLIMYSAALGSTILLVRITSCFLCGIVAGILVRFFYCKGTSYFKFDSFDTPKSHDTDPNIMLRFIKNLWRNIRATGLWFLAGIALSAVFQRYVPQESIVRLFGKGNEGFAILLAATVGVPLYVCGGGTIPLLQQWLASGMSAGSAASFMITGPSTKITNLGALKIALGIGHFTVYIIFVIAFSLFTGFAVNLIL